jgi:hypothetical protein
VAGNVIAGDRLIIGATPVPLSVTTFGLLGAFEGTLAVPVKVPSAVAVNVSEKVQLSPVIPLGASVTPEHISDVVAKFGPPLGPPVVAVVIVPIVIGTADWFNAVRNPLYGTVVPLFAYVEFGNEAEYGVTFSGAFTA